MESSMVFDQGFTAVLRWQGPDPSIEIETRHPGFDTPEDAALFANGLLPNAPIELHLVSRGLLELLKPDGHCVEWPAQGATVWALPADATKGDELVLASDDDFKPHQFADFAFPPSAFGEYMQGQFAVLDRDGSPVDVVVELREHGHFRITVRWDTAAAEDVLAFIGSVPDA